MPKKKSEFVIRYDGTQKSYFKGWTQPVKIPQFGATIHETPRYMTADQARQEIFAMPATASIMCEVKEVPPKKTSKKAVANG